MEDEKRNESERLREEAEEKKQKDKQAAHEKKLQEQNLVGTSESVADQYFFDGLTSFN